MKPFDDRGMASLGGAEDCLCMAAVGGGIFGTVGDIV